VALFDFLGKPSGIEPGEPAPDFTLPDADEKLVRLSDLLGKPVVLYFYPKDETPGCTLEACAFRDQYEDFVDAGAVVVGVSSDSSASHRAFAKRHRLPFTLLADRDGAVRKRYGVPSTLGLLPGRVTFVIDSEGVVRHVFNSQLAATRHVSEALDALRSKARHTTARKPRAPRTTEGANP
jgi:peroxiredoxin Q/BCP